ncbi:MAG: EAL domain-containing protein [Pseudomonadota bacterium]
MLQAAIPPDDDLILAALEAGHGALAFQPIVDAQGRVLFQEALLRLLLADGSEAAPAAFIPVAEAQDLTAEMDCVAFSLALNVLERGGAARISVNVHPKSLTTEVFRATTAATPTALMERLFVEVTENALVDADGLAVLRDIRAQGASILIDDFGAGAQSLDLVRAGICDGLKLDRGLVDGLAGDATKRAIARALLRMGRELDLMVIGEGVERSADADWLIKNGVDGLQGFLYGRPTRKLKAQQQFAVA